jgi:hypothetical protein
MEDPMLAIRIITISAVLSAFAVAGAAAQTATASAPGKPLPLLQFSQHKGKTKPWVHLATAKKVVKKTPARTRVAKRAPATRHGVHVAARPPRMPVQTATVTEPANMPPANMPPANIWPAADSAPPGAVQALAPLPPVAVTTEPAVEMDANEIAAGGHALQAASPNDGNAIDPAAGDPHNGAGTASAAIPSKIVQTQPIVRAMVAAAAPQNESPVGSASWIAQVLAALGGAITAGVVAWLLIRPAPERIYE